MVYRGGLARVCRCPDGGGGGSGWANDRTERDEGVGAGLRDDMKQVAGVRASSGWEE